MLPQKRAEKWFATQLSAFDLLSLCLSTLALGFHAFPTIQGLKMTKIHESAVDSDEKSRKVSQVGSWWEGAVGSAQFSAFV